MNLCRIAISTSTTCHNGADADKLSRCRSLDKRQRAACGVGHSVLTGRLVNASHAHDVAAVCVAVVAAKRKSNRGAVAGCLGYRRARCGWRVEEQDSATICAEEELTCLGVDGQLS